MQPTGQTIRVNAHESLMAAAQRQGYRWPTLCNGSGECTICFVKVLAGVENTVPPQSAETDRLADCGRVDPDIRLACRLEVRGPVTVFKRGVRKAI